MNTSRTYSAVKEQVKAKFSWKYAGGALGVAVVVLLLSLVQPWSTTSYELSDSGVWVSKGPALGRVNSQVAQMDYVGDEKKGRKIQESAEAGPILVQGGRSVFLVADGGDSIEAPKPQEPTADQKPLAIPGVKELALGGGTGNDQVVVARTESEVFLVARGGALLRSSQQPLMKVGPKSQVAVGSGGTVVAYSPQDGKKEATLQYRELGNEDVRKETLNSAPGEGATLTMVGEQVVLLDAKNQKLLLPGSDPILLGGLDSPEVQLPGPQSDSVVVADDNKLLSVDLKSGDVEPISSDGDGGTPVRPAVDADCVHGAWKTVVVASCGGGDSMKADLDPEDAGPWYFRTGGVTALLNSYGTGNSWMVFDQNELKKVLWPKSEPDKERSEQEEETPPDRDQKQQPKAICEKEGELGARKGKVTYLNVLANDKDPNRDPILVSKVSHKDGPKFEIAQGGRSIQIDTTSATKEGQAYKFRYRVHDGQEESEEVECEVQIVPAGQNNPPKKLTEKTVLAFDAVRNQQVNYDLLAHFIDPEGDPIILSKAQVEDPRSGDKVSFDPTGFIYFTSAGKTSTVTAFVQDVPPNEQGETLSWPVQARVAGDNKPPTARNDVVEVVVNETKTVQPLLNDSDPNGDDLILEGKIEVKGDNTGKVDILPSDEKSFALKVSQAGYYTLSYKVSDGGPDPVEGRITVKASPKDESSLVALNDVVIVNVGSTARVDLLANDSDASNGVLSVVDLVSPTPLQPPTPDPCSALSGSVLNDFSTFQVVALDDAMAEKTCNFGYEITNSQGKKASAQISVVIVKRNLSNEPPEFIHPETFRVRAKQVGVIPLGAFAQDPEGDPITVLLDKEKPLKAGLGQIHQSGNDLKYVAPQDPLAEPVVVHVKISDQLRATTPLSGTIKIQVIQAPNIPPVPKNVTVRVRAGQEISIPVPLVGLDEDWTPLELSGIKLIKITDRLLGTPKVLDGTQTISYIAPENVSSTQTDKFRYFVKDTNGGEGSALVTVQISPRENNPPIAVLDKVTAQKGSPVWINPVSNDTDLDGDFLKLEEPYTAPPGCKAEPDEGRLKITAESNCTIGYSVSDYGQGGGKLVKKSGALGKIVVTVGAQDFNLRPIARDDYATPDAKPDDDFAKVNVLANDEDPDGLTSDLTIDFGDDSKSISDKDSPGTIKIKRTKSPQRLQYSITDKQGLPAVAFVWVPSQDENEPPMERENHDPIIFKIGEPAKEIKLADYIIDPEGTELTFKNVSSIQSQAGDTELNKTLSQGTVMFEPRKDTAGLGGLQVTATDKGGESATIVLAIQIQPADNLPPSWKNPNYCDKVLVEQGSKGNPKKSAQLQSLVDNAQDLDDLSKASLTFEKISDSGDQGIEVNVTREGNFTASASDEVVPGAIKTVSVKVKDRNDEESEEALECSIVVGYTTDEPVRVRPGVQLVTKQGQAIKVEIASLLEQPGTGAKFVDTPPGKVRGTVQTSATTLTYTPGIDDFGEVNIPFTVQETRVCASTKQECKATGNIVVLVTGRPTGLTPPTAVGGADSDAVIVLTYKEPDRNSDPSPVTYSIRSDKGNLVTKDCGTSLTCTVNAGDGVKNAIDYSFVLTAKNATGESKSLPSNLVQTDVKPLPPDIPNLTVEGDTTLKFAFDEPKKRANGMSSILEYQCLLSDGQTKSADLSNLTCSFDGLTNGTSYTLRVSTITAYKGVKNTSEPSEASAQGTPFGKPKFVSQKLDSPGIDGKNVKLNLTATVDRNGRDVVSVEWKSDGSCKKSGSSNSVDKTTLSVSFLCPRTPGPITATITATNEGGSTTTEDLSYKFPDKPTAKINSVTPGSYSLLVSADGFGNRLEYSLDGKRWDDPTPFDSVPAWKPTDVYVRACSPEWPECSVVEDSKGTAYGDTPTPVCGSGSVTNVVEKTYTCVLAWTPTDGTPSGDFDVEIIGEYYPDKDGKITVPCDDGTEVFLQHNPYVDGDPGSEVLEVSGPAVCKF